MAASKKEAPNCLCLCLVSLLLLHPVLERRFASRPPVAGNLEAASSSLFIARVRLSEDAASSV